MTLIMNPCKIKLFFNKGSVGILCVYDKSICMSHIRTVLCGFVNDVVLYVNAPHEGSMLKVKSSHCALHILLIIHVIEK